MGASYSELPRMILYTSCLFECVRRLPLWSLLFLHEVFSFLLAIIIGSPKTCISLLEHQKVINESSPIRSILVSVVSSSILPLERHNRRPKGLGIRDSSAAIM